MTMRNYHADGSRDPLRNIDTEGKELFKKFSAASNGHSFDAAIDAGANSVVNAIRQSYESRAGAERRFDEVAGKAKQALMDCYDGTTGRRRGVFPHTQFLYPPLMRGKPDA